MDITRQHPQMEIAKQGITAKNSIKIVIAALFLLFFMALASSMYVVLAMNSVVPLPFSLPFQPEGRVAAQEQATPPLSQTQVNNLAAQHVAQQYMQALLTQHYATMWSLLAPQVQAMWPDESTFATFWQVRYQDYTLQHFTMTPAHALAYWMNPETMAQYNQVEMMRVSLQLTLKVTPATGQSVPPEDLDPSSVLKNLPVIVQQMANPSGQGQSWLVLSGGPADLEAPILPPLTPVVHSVQVPILMYHHVSDAPTYNVLDLSLTVTPTMFSQQLDYLKAQGYHSITFNQLMNALYYGGPLPTKPIIFSFDDGYEDNYHFAYDILRQHSYTGIFYIITGKVGWDGQMNWGQLQDMLRHGMQIGSHTIHHVDMGAVLQDSELQAQQELQLSKATLEKNLGITIQYFCYPNGGPFKHGSLALRQRIMVLLAADGYISATTDPGMTGIVQQSTLPFDMLRVRVDGRESMLGFKQSIPA